MILQILHQFLMLPHLLYFYLSFIKKINLSKQKDHLVLYKHCKFHDNLQKAQNARIILTQIDGI